MKKIPLTKNEFALVDDEDYDFLMRWKWSYARGYAIRANNFKKPCGKRSTNIIHMHRVVNNTPDGFETDHINDDKLDNRKDNLRSCTKSENNMNRKSYERSSSKYKGVFLVKSNKKWRASIGINGKRKTLGTFELEIDAAKAYNKSALIYFGEFARLNILN